MQNGRPPPPPAIAVGVVNTSAPLFDNSGVSPPLTVITPQPPPVTPAPVAPPSVYGSAGPASVAVLAGGGSRTAEQLALLLGSAVGAAKTESREHFGQGKQSAITPAPPMRVPPPILPQLNEPGGESVWRAGGGATALAAAAAASGAPQPAPPQPILPAPDRLSTAPYFGVKGKGAAARISEASATAAAGNGLGSTAPASDAHADAHAAAHAAATAHGDSNGDIEVLIPGAGVVRFSREKLASLGVLIHDESDGGAASSVQTMPASAPAPAPAPAVAPSPAFQLKTPAPPPPRSRANSGSSTNSLALGDEKQAFFTACETGDLRAITSALTRNPQLITAADALGRTGLCFAARGGHMTVLAALEATGADLRVTDSGGRSPLCYAARHGTTDAVAWMLARVGKAGARVSDVDACTPLHHAVLGAGESDAVAAVVAKLLANGADAKAKNSDGKTPGEVAIERGHAKAAMLLAGMAAASGEED